MNSTKSKEERIREEAFILWNADGRPEGKADYYWYEAERVIERQDRLTDQADERGDL